jgi:hypothetical protein
MSRIKITGSIVEAARTPVTVEAAAVAGRFTKRCQS